MPPIQDLFLNSTGRTGRRAFVLSGGLLLGLWLAFDLARPVWTPAVVVWLVAGACLYAGCCVLSQRLHDRGRSGWWSGPILLLIAAVLPFPSAPLDWIALILLGGVAVDLALAPGQPRFNRHGPARRPQSGATPG